MSDEAKFYGIFGGEFKNYAIVPINSEAPYIVTLWMKFLSSEKGIERIFFEEFYLLSCFPLDLNI